MPEENAHMIVFNNNNKKKAKYTYFQLCYFMLKKRSGVCLTPMTLGKCITGDCCLLLFSLVFVFCIGNQKKNSFDQAKTSILRIFIEQTGKDIAYQSNNQNLCVSLGFSYKLGYCLSKVIIKIYVYHLDTVLQPLLTAPCQQFIYFEEYYL